MILLALNFLIWMPRKRCFTLGHRAISSTMVHVGTSDLQASEAAAEAMMAMY
jgi:hypothetical protein